jgi:hypothetical protein
MQARYRLDLADRFAVSSATARRFAANPSDPTSRWAPCPAHSYRWTITSLPSSSCARRGITPAYWLRTPLGVGPTGLPPASNTASPARTTRLSDSRRSFISGYGLGLPLAARPAADMPPREPSRTGHHRLLTGDHRASRFSRMEIPHMPGFSDRAGSTGHSHDATDDLAFRLVVRRRHPKPAFRGSIAPPMRTPVNASPTPSRTPTHDSGPPWIATPSM